MAFFKVMILNVGHKLSNQHQKGNIEQQLERQKTKCQIIVDKITKQQPDILFLQDIQGKCDIQDVDSKLKDMGVYYSYLYRETVDGIIAIVVRAKTFDMENLKFHNYAKSSASWRKVFNSMAFLKLTHRETNTDIYVASFCKDLKSSTIEPSAVAEFDENTLYVDTMRKISNGNLWIIGGQHVNELKNGNHNSIVSNKSCNNNNNDNIVEDYNKVNDNNNIISSNAINNTINNNNSITNSNSNHNHYSNIDDNLDINNNKNMDIVNAIHEDYPVSKQITNEISSNNYFIHNRLSNLNKNLHFKDVSLVENSNDDRNYLSYSPVTAVVNLI